MTDYYFENPDHPLNGKFNINFRSWTSPIGEITFNLPEEMSIGLIDYIVKKVYRIGRKTLSNKEREPDQEDTKYVSKHFYNLLTEADTNPHIKQYKEFMDELIRYYVANAWKVGDVQEYVLQAKCFGNMQVKGQRTYPHYHHGFDGVCVTYLTIGDEFDLDLTSDNLIVPYDASKDVVIPDKYDADQVPDAKWSQYKDTSHPVEFEEQGALLLLDPRSTPNYPYNTKAKAFKPVIGKTIIHPAYFWHESNSFEAGGIRVCIILNFKVGLGKSKDPLVDFISKSGYDTLNE